MIENTLIYNYLIGLNKKAVSKLERAALIKRYMEDNNKTLSQLSRELNIPKTTLHTWMKFNNIRQEDYDTLKKRGFTDTEIFHLVRDGKLTSQNINSMEAYLNRLNDVFKRMLKNNDEFQDKDILILTDIQNNINRIISKIGRRR